MVWAPRFHSRNGALAIIRPSLNETKMQHDAGHNNGRTPRPAKNPMDSTVLGTLEGTRTPSLLFRRQALYPLSYEGVLMRAEGSIPAMHDSCSVGLDWASLPFCPRLFWNNDRDGWSSPA